MRGGLVQATSAPRVKCVSRGAPQLEQARFSMTRQRKPSKGCYPDRFQRPF